MKGSGGSVEKLLGRIRSDAGVWSFRQRGALRKLLKVAEENPAVRERLLAEAVADPFGPLLNALFARGWVPSAPESRALFLLFAGDLAGLFRFHAGVRVPLFHLRVAYEAGDSLLRDHVRRRVRELRDERLAVVFQPLQASDPDAAAADTGADPVLEVALNLAWSAKQYQRVLTILQQGRIHHLYEHLGRLLQVRFAPEDERSRRLLAQARELLPPAALALETLKLSFRDAHWPYVRALESAAKGVAGNPYSAAQSGVAGLHWVLAARDGRRIPAAKIEELFRSPHWLARASAWVIVGLQPEVWRLDSFLQGAADGNPVVSQCALSTAPLLPVSVPPAAVMKLQAARRAVPQGHYLQPVLEFVQFALSSFVSYAEFVEDYAVARSTDFELEEDAGAEPEIRAETGGELNAPPETGAAGDGGGSSDARA